MGTAGRETGMTPDNDRRAPAQGEEGGLSRAQSQATPPPHQAILSNVPFAVSSLAALLAAIFLIMQALPAGIEASLSERFGFSPERLFAGIDAPGDVVGMIAPLVTHALLHASVPHLLFNLLWLFVFGAPIARRWPGGVRFYAFFLSCSVAGALFFALFHRHDATLLVGASGGITGLLGGLVRFAFHRPSSRPASARGVLPLFDRSVLTWTAVVIAMNASAAILGPSVGAGDADIAWQAHVGGFLFGVLAFPLFDGMGDRQ